MMHTDFGYTHYPHQVDPDRFSIHLHQNIAGQESYSQDHKFFMNIKEPNPFEASFEQFNQFAGLICSQMSCSNSISSLPIASTNTYSSVPSLDWSSSNSMSNDCGLESISPQSAIMSSSVHVASPSPLHEICSSPPTPPRLNNTIYTSFTHNQPPQMAKEEQLNKKEDLLQRNRAAAAKCRRKKKEWLSKTRREIQAFEEDNYFQEQNILKLKEEIVNLKLVLATTQHL